MAADPVIAIDALLAALGFASAEAQQAARSAIEEVGLTRAGKTRIASSKRDRVAAILAERFVVACNRDACRADAERTGRRVVPAQHPTDCHSCRGSVNTTLVGRVVEALLRRGWSRLVIVGGSPALHTELRALVQDRLQLRLIDGTARRTAKDAKSDIAWADLIVVWGGTLLDHKVSKLYTDSGSTKVVSLARRGIAALAEHVLVSVATRS